MPLLTRVPDGHPRAEEIEITAGWSIEIPVQATPPLVTSGEELRRYLNDAMHVQVAPNRQSQLGD